MPSVRLLAIAALAASLTAACGPSPSNGPSAARNGNDGQRDAATPTSGDVGPEVVATAPFDSVELRGGGHVTLRYGATEKVTLLQGSTAYTKFHVEDGNKLVIDVCESDCPSHYDLDVEIVTPRVTGVAIDGGGHIEAASGFPEQGMVAAAVNGGGDVDLRALTAQTGTASVAGGGKIHIHAAKELTAAVEGGGSIRYSGTTNVTTTVLGGGSIEAESGE